MDGEGLYKELDKSEIWKVISQFQDKHLVLVFSADWLGAALIWDEYMKEFARELRKDFCFFRINIDHADGLLGEFNVVRVPTTFVFYREEIVGHFSGVMPKRKMLENLKGFSRN